MKRIVQIMVLLIGLAHISSAQIVVESFNYEELLGSEVDGYADGGIGWDGPWTVFEGDPYDLIIDEEGELPEGVDFTTTGCRLTGECSGVALRAYRKLATPIMDEGDNLWLSFIIETENWLNDSWSGVSFWSPDGVGEQSLFGKNWGRSLWGMVFTGKDMDSMWGVEDNVPVWIVVKVEFSGDENDEECFLWINPDTSKEPEIGDANVSLMGNLKDGVTHIACHLGNTKGIIVSFDEIILAKTFEEAVPVKKVGVNDLTKSESNSTYFPNPIQSSLTIDYKLNRNDIVKLDIYNINGMKVKSLVNGVQKSGNYSVEWDAEGYPSGAYFYTLQIGNSVDRNKILVK
ncbi:MAG TPA: T9SS type A sorting domain-containing protein [Prolixibacteraceae bacterium]|nr:T9SS type A sorting domain-containing protein [Prolixibacteraceae bacterium]